MRADSIRGSLEASLASSAALLLQFQFRFRRLHFQRGSGSGSSSDPVSPASKLASRRKMNQQPASRLLLLLLPLLFVCFGRHPWQASGSSRQARRARPAGRLAPQGVLFGQSAAETATASSATAAAAATAAALSGGDALSAGQCPNLGANLSPLAGKFGSNDKVLVEPESGRRSFEAKIVGIFSCLDADSASNDLTLDFRLAKPVIDLAVRAVNSKYSHIRFNVTYRTAPDICKHQQAAGHAADEYYGANGANYFVGPGCSESLASVGQLASYWNVPMCSTGYLPEVVTARFKPLTLMQLSLSVQSVGEMLLELFQMYKWRHLVIVTDEKHPLHSLIRDGLLEFFNTMYLLSSAQPATGGQHQQQPQPQQQQQGSNRRQERANLRSTGHPYYINISSRNFPYSKSEPVDYEQVMLDAASYSRVMLLLARSVTIGHLLEAAHNQGMSRGQFVFIAHELFETQMVEPAGSGPTGAGSLAAKQHQPSPLGYSLDDKIQIRADGNATHDERTREIFQPLMTISLRIPVTAEFDAFRSEVAELCEREFNYRIQTSSLKSRYSLGLAAFIYDCVMLYADKVNFVLSETQFGKIDGKTIFELSAGKSWRGALTGDLTINRAGQRVIDFTLNHFAPDKLTLEPIAHFLAIERRLSFLEGKMPHWAAKNQSAPRSDPRCRINDLFCRYLDEETEQLANYHLGADRVVLSVWHLMLIFLLVTLVFTAIGWLLYRRSRIESELMNLWWSIKYEDILFEEEAEALCDGKRSMSSLAISNESFTGQTGDGCQRSLSGSGRGSPSQLQASRAELSQVQVQVQQQPDCQSVGGGGGGAGLAGQTQLSVCHSLGQDGQTVLSAAHSTSTLSAAAPSIGGSTSALASATRSAQPDSSALLNSGSARLAGRAQKLAPLSKPKKKATGSGKFSGSSGQLGGASGKQRASNNKDPSISSQNKNAKLRLGTVLNGGADRSHVTKVGLYKASRVAAKHLNVRNLNINNRQLLIELRQVRDLTHENLIKFIGLCPEEPNIAIVSELCTRGNLQDLLQNETIRLDWPFRYSIINDIVDGLTHLHSSPIQFHGRLKSSNCVIDNRFVVKLTDFGLPTLLAAVEFEENVNPRLLLWTAPEHLRTKHPLLSGSQKGDIYSLAIIFQEIITRCGPFECEPILCGASELAAPLDWQPVQAVQQQQQGGQLAPLIRTIDAAGQPLAARGQSARRAQGRQLGARAANLQVGAQQPQQQPMLQPVVVQHKQRLEPEEIVNLVRMGLSPPFRPYFRPDVAGSAGSADFNVADLIATVQSCWQEAPATRPSVTNVKQQIKKMRRGCHLDGANLMDNLLQRMERYTDNLESLVEQKTAELMEEKKRSEELLYEMLPRFVVDQLKYGHSVTPEAYEAVTISFSDIKDFTSIAAQSSPIEVVNLLNQLYTEFDDCIAQYDVYKVETIGDAYMVVSGLPVRNGDQHAREIAEMSLALLELIRNFDVAHLPHVNLELRIGIHSGPCASGVVGTRMFRYCLFGDTVSLQR